MYISKLEHEWLRPQYWWSGLANMGSVLLQATASTWSQHDYNTVCNLCNVYTAWVQSCYKPQLEANTDLPLTPWTLNYMNLVYIKRLLLGPSPQQMCSTLKQHNCTQIALAHHVGHHYYTRPCCDVLCKLWKLEQIPSDSILKCILWISL